MSWWGKYIGVPFVDGGRTPEALDCWGLVRLIYEQERGITLPSYGEISVTDLLGIARAINGGREPWGKVESPQDFDVVAMRFYGRSWIGHVGVMVDGENMIHTEEATASAVLPLSHFSVRDRVAGFWRLT